jgi:hypothetical protein
MEKAGNVVPLEASPASVTMGDILAKGLSDLVYRSPKQRKAAED